MKNGGLNIFKNVSRFLKGVFIKNINKEISGEILIIDPQDKVASSTYLSTSKNKISVGSRSLDAFEIQRARTASGTGVALNVKAGDGFGTDKAGGDLNLYGGASTGSTNGGKIRFWQGQRAGSSGSTLNDWIEMFNVDAVNSAMQFVNITTLKFPGLTKIQSNDALELTIDLDNDDTISYFAIKDYTATRLFMPDDGNLYLMSASNSTGLFLDAINSTISAGSQATHSGTDANTDLSGGVNTTGKTLTITGGAGTGNGDGGGISFGTYPAGGSGIFANATYEEKMAMSNDGSLQLDGSITLGADDNSAATIKRLRHTDEEGGDLYIRGGDATGTDKAGGDLQIFGGRATGNGAGGAVIIQAGETHGSGGVTTLRGTNVIASFRTDGDTLLQGNLIFEGSVPDAHETTFSVTNPTADRTITVPNSSGTMALTGVNYTYQYISFTGNATVPSDGDWITLSANGISNHSWNINLGSGGTTVDTSTVTIPTGNICQGIIVPYDCVLVGYSSLIRSVGNHQSKVGLAVGVPTYNDFATFDCTLRAYNAADISAGPDTNYSQRPVRADNLSVNYSMSAGHVIFPLIGSIASNSRTVQWNCTLVLKTLLP